MFLAIEKRLQELLSKNRKALMKDPNPIKVTPELYKKYVEKYQKVKRPPSRSVFLTNI